MQAIHSRLAPRLIVGPQFARQRIASAGLRRASQPSIVHQDGSSLNPTYDRDPADQAAEAELEPRRQAHALDLVNLAMEIADSPHRKLPQATARKLIQAILDGGEFGRAGADQIAASHGVSISTVYATRERMRAILIRD